MQSRYNAAIEVLLLNKTPLSSLIIRGIVLLLSFRFQKLVICDFCDDTMKLNFKFEVLRPNFMKCLCFVSGVVGNLFD